MGSKLVKLKLLLANGFDEIIKNIIFKNFNTTKKPHTKIANISQKSGENKLGRQEGPIFFLYKYHSVRQN